MFNCADKKWNDDLLIFCVCVEYEIFGWLWKVCVFSITQFLYWAKSKVTKFLSTYQIISHIIGNSENNAVIAETDGDNVVDSNDAYEARLCRSIWRVLSVDLWCGVVISFVYRGFFFYTATVLITSHKQIIDNHFFSEISLPSDWNINEITRPVSTTGLCVFPWNLI